MKKCAIGFLITFVLFTSTFNNAIASDYNKAIIENISVKVPLLDVYLNIVDDSDNIVRKDIEINDIDATLGNEALEVLSCDSIKQSDIGTAYFLLMDISGSAGKDFSKIISALTTWVNKLGINDRLVLLTFGEEVELVLDGSENKDDIVETIGALETGDRRTRLLDCIYRTLNIMQSSNLALPDRKVIICVTDGEEISESSITFQEIEERLVETKIPFYTFAVSSPTKEDIELLGKLSRSTNAKVVTLESDTIISEFENLLKELESGYHISLRMDDKLISNGKKVLAIKITTDSEEFIVTEEIMITNFSVDNIQPKIVEISAINSRNIIVCFSEEVIGANEMCNFYLEDSSGKSLVIINLSYKNGKTILVLGDDIEDGEYKLAVSNIYDYSIERNPIFNNERIFKVTGLDIVNVITDSSDETSDTNIIFNIKNFRIFVIAITIVFIGLLIAILFLIIFRRKKSVVEDTKQNHEDPNSELINLRNTVLGYAKGSSKAINHINDKIENYTKLIEEQQREIAKYKEGYNYSINKSVIGQTIRLIEEINEMPQDENLNLVKKQLIYSLENNGIFQFCSVPLDSFEPSRSKCVGTVLTTEKEKENTIARVVNPGYKIEITEGQWKTLIPENVEIFIYEK